MLAMFVIRTEQNISRFEYQPFPWYCDTAFFALGFFVLGYLAKINNWDRFLLTGRNAFMALLFYCLFVAFFHKVSDVEFHFITNYYSSLPFFLFVSLLGIYVMASVCNQFKSKYIQMLGSNTLLLFAINWHIFILLTKYCKFDNLLGIIPDYVWSLAVSAVQAAIILVISVPINKYIPWVIGKTK